VARIRHARRMTITLDPIAAGAALGVTALVLAWMTRRAYRRRVLVPLRSLADAADRMGRGDYATPVPARFAGTIGEAGRALERLRASLAETAAAHEASQRRSREILDRSLQGFYQTTLDGRFLAANPAMAALLGYESVDALLAEPTGTTERLYVEPCQRREFVGLMDTQGFVSGFESALRRKDGRVIWVTEVARRVVDADGRTYLEGFVEDITARKETDRLKADFVSFVTHQLRTPLAGIRWMLELAEQGTLDAEVAPCVADARLSAERLITLVNDLLEVTRLESGRAVLAPEPIDLAAVTREILDKLGPAAAARHQTVTVDTSDVPPVLIDPHLLRQAVGNFVSNAIKFTPPNGSIQIRAALDGDSVHWSVRDTGIGVPPAAQTRLFEKFFRAENAQVVDTEGTGLGLYLVRLIAIRAGGAVACVSTEGEGSTFTLTLPAAPVREAVT
jgi:Amt family ammonium transporter